jgi:hypothetical protein
MLTKHLPNEQSASSAEQRNASMRGAVIFQAESNVEGAPMRESDIPKCPECREPMKLIRTIQHLGVLPELRVFYCAACKEVEMREEYRHAA